MRCPLPSSAEPRTPPPPQTNAETPPTLPWAPKSSVPSPPRPSPSTRSIQRSQPGTARPGRGSTTACIECRNGGPIVCDAHTSHRPSASRTATRAALAAGATATMSAPAVNAPTHAMREASSGAPPASRTRSTRTRRSAKPTTRLDVVPARSSVAAAQTTRCLAGPSRSVAATEPRPPPESAGRRGARERPPRRSRRSRTRPNGRGCGPARRGPRRSNRRRSTARTRTPRRRCRRTPTSVEGATTGFVGGRGSHRAADDEQRPHSARPGRERAARPHLGVPAPALPPAAEPSLAVRDEQQSPSGAARARAAPACRLRRPSAGPAPGWGATPSPQPPAAPADKEGAEALRRGQRAGATPHAHKPVRAARCRRRGPRGGARGGDRRARGREPHGGDTVAGSTPLPTARGGRSARSPAPHAPRLRPPGRCPPSGRAPGHTTARGGDLRGRIGGSQRGGLRGGGA